MSKKSEIKKLIYRNARIFRLSIKDPINTKICVNMNIRKDYLFNIFEIDDIDDDVFEKAKRHPKNCSSRIF